MDIKAQASLPVIAVAMGDPSGISPELTARILVEPDLSKAARYVVFGDYRLFQLGADDAGLTPDLHVVGEGDALPADAGKPVFVDLKNHDPADLQRGKATLAGGKAATDNFRRALRLAASGKADAVFFTPFNKAAMRFAYPGYDDEIRFVRDAIEFEGPFPSDTVFLRAKNGDFDAVLTMYHDQGQIAMKLMGFDRGVTLIGGFPFPICTPAHGTAYEIAGKGIANLGATRAALSLAIKMAGEGKAARKAA